MLPRLSTYIFSRLQIALAVLFCMGSTLCPAADVDFPASLQIKSLFASKAAHTFTEMDLVIEQLYHQNNYQPLWVTPQGMSRRATLITQTLEASHHEGLIPQDYLVEEIHRLQSSLLPGDQAQLDLHITAGLAKYLVDSLSGRINPCLITPRIFPHADKKAVDLFPLLKKTLTTHDLPGFLAELHPQYSEYRLLRTALARYRRLSLNKEWDVIPSGPSIHPGEVDDRLPLIIQRLQLHGDLSHAIEQTSLYSGETIDAVRRFQARFSLEQDGIVGKQTLKALNTPILELLRRIMINMERWRWLPRTLPDKRIMVNIPGFNLTVYEDHHPVLHMSVIVGRVHTETPVFSDEMRFLVFNPYWNIPASIAEEEIIPQQAENPAYLEENRIKLFKGWEENTPAIDPENVDWVTIGAVFNNYRLRQEPGEGNPLGSLKFLFPNEHHVYLHDTPTKNLFKASRRAFSHGCIRVSDPMALAVFLLKTNTPSWDRQRIEQQIDSGVRKIVRLDDSLPIHIVYKTVSVDPLTEEVFFYHDLYEKDAHLLAGLTSPEKETLCLLKSR